MSKTTLSVFQAEILACLPVAGKEGATVPDIADDVYDRPLMREARPEVPASKRRANVRSAIVDIRELVPGTTKHPGIVCFKDINAAVGERYSYTLTHAAAEWVREQLVDLLPGEIVTQNHNHSVGAA